MFLMLTHPKSYFIYFIASYLLLLLLRMNYTRSIFQPGFGDEKTEDVDEAVDTEAEMRRRGLNFGASLKGTEMEKKI